ncbi:acyl-CoA synthetase [Parashewanella curva]|uniref:Acyl-CoA synthetase n=1 Tax=Parashewanella curva TaxID=2338552 RepID=A0A3L8PYT8_9GAMM|nr:AMP-binding protein [Parashewanella curva]RLV60524.1 acyl-CoA synthetase [Parashewanella curva]
MKTADFYSWLCHGANPDSVCFFDDKCAMQGKQFNQLISHYTKILSEHKAKSWLVHAQNSDWFAIGLVSAILAGKTVILPANTQPETLNKMRTLVEAELSPTPSFSESDALHLQKVERFAHEMWPASSDLGRLILYTSGSSGEPKAIEKSICQLAAEIENLERCFSADFASEDTRIYSTVSHQHIYGLLFKVLWPLVTGRAIFIPLISYPEVLFDAFHSRKNKVLISSPAFLERLTSEKTNGFNKLLVFSSGGPLSFKGASLSQEVLGVHPIEVFGSTETGGIAYRQQVSNNTTWQPFPKVNVTCDAKSKRLRIQSPYLHNTDWYECDDKISIEDTGKFRLLGRIDRIVKIEEKRVSITAMEKYLLQHSDIEQAVITVLEHTRRQLAAVIVFKPSGEKQLQKMGKFQQSRLLKQYLSKEFELVTLPRKWRFVSQIPLSSQGKRDQSALRELFEHD